MMRRVVFLGLLALLLLPCCPATASVTPAERAMNRAEHLLHLPPFPLFHKPHFETAPGSTDMDEVGEGNAETAFKQIIKKYGLSERALAGLGQSQRNYGEHKASEETFRRALKHWPRSHRAQNLIPKSSGCYEPCTLQVFTWRNYHMKEIGYFSGVGLAG